MDGPGYFYCSRCGNLTAMGGGLADDGSPLGRRIPWREAYCGHQPGNGFMQPHHEEYMDEDGWAKMDGPLDLRGLGDLLCRERITGSYRAGLQHGEESAESRAAAAAALGFQSRNVVEPETAERNRTEGEGGYTFNAFPPDDYEGPVVVVAALGLGDHAHIDWSSGGQIIDPTGKAVLHRGEAGSIILRWPEWLLLRGALDAVPWARIAEVENPRAGQLQHHGHICGCKHFHTAADAYVTCDREVDHPGVHEGHTGRGDVEWRWWSAEPEVNVPAS